MKLSPLQQVKQQFGGREKLVDAIIPLLESKDDDTRARLMGSPNRKLLRIHALAIELKERFGSRKNLTDKIIGLKYPNGSPDDGYVKRVEEATHKRLLDMYTQNGGR